MSGARTDVHTRQELAGEQRGAAALELSREARSLDIAGRQAGWAIEQLTDEEFDQLLELDRRREGRLKKMITNRMQEGVHFGTVPGIAKPFAWEPAADEILKLFRWNALPIGEPFIHRSGEYVEATVTVGIYDLAGRQIGPATMRSCGTLEKRFRNKTSNKWKYDDARESVNECVAMAFKRGKVAGTLSSAGAKAYFASPELLEPADDPASAAVTEPWTDEERATVYAASAKAGIRKRKDLLQLIQDTLGRSFVGTGQDVEVLLAAIAKQAAGVTPVKDATAEYGQPAPAATVGEPQPAPETPPAPEPLAADDLSLDQELADHDR